MAIETHIHDGTDWRKAKDVFMHDGSAWRQAKQIYVHDGTTWRLVFSKDYWVPIGNLTNCNCLASFNGSLYCGTTSGLYHWDGNAWIAMGPSLAITQLFATASYLYALANASSSEYRGVILQFDTANVLAQTIVGYNNLSISSFGVASPNIKANCSGYFCSFNGVAWTYLSNYNYTFDHQGQPINGRIYLTNTGAPTTRSIPVPDDGSMYVHSSAWADPAGQAFCWSNYGLTCADQYNRPGIWYLTGTTWTRIGTGMGGCPSIMYDGSRIIATDYYAGVKYWTGSTWTLLGFNSPTYVNFVIQHGGSLFACGLYGVHRLVLSA